MLAAEALWLEMWLWRMMMVTRWSRNLNHCIKIIWLLLCKQGSSRVFDIRNMLVQTMKRACWSLLAFPRGGKVLEIPKYFRVEATTDDGRRRTEKFERRTARM